MDEKTRQEMIDALVEYNMEEDLDGFEWMLRNGFEGFANMSDEDLQKEYDLIKEFVGSDSEGGE